MRPRVAVAAAVAGALAAGAGGVALLAAVGGGGGDGAAATSTTVLTSEQRSERERSTAWLAEAQQAFSDLGVVLRPMLDRTTRWAEGGLGDDELRGELDRFAPAFASTVDRLHELPALDLAPEADRLFELAAWLYTQVPDVYRAAIDVDDGALRSQVDLLGRRVRVMADRVFDRGYALVEPFLHRGDGRGVTLNRPEEVPRWDTLSLAPGPPLAPEPAESDDPFPVREEKRPEQRRDAWIGAVELVNPPAGTDLAATIDGGGDAELRATAERLIAAVEALRGEPDPAGDREASARLRLGLLVHADAARAAQAAALAAAPEATEGLLLVARRLAVIGGDAVLWVAELPARDPGYDAELLGLR